MMRRMLRSILILLLIGTFVSARQAASNPDVGAPAEGARDGAVESVFTADDSALDLRELASSIRMPSGAGMSAAHADTVETYDIQLEDEKGSAITAKTIAALVVIGLFVGIALYVLIGQDEEAPADDDNGKPLPDYSRGVIVPIPGP